MSLEPYDLTCESLREPLGMDDPNPGLSWRLRSTHRGDCQTGYRIDVTTEEGRLVWNTGHVALPETLHVPYAGRPLQPTTRYHWQVQVWDGGGRASGSARSWFETGLMSPSRWRAVWIGHDPATTLTANPPADEGATLHTRHLPPTPHLRRPFRTRALPTRARLYITARGLYQARINGQRVGDAELAPGWTDYRHRICYQAYDATLLLVDGENVLAVMLGEGWWSGYVGFDPRRGGKLYGDAPALLAQLHLVYPDGTTEVVATDSRWRESPGGIRYADLLMGEYHDARLAPHGWDRPGFDDSAWAPVGVHDRDLSTVRAATAPPVRVVANVEPVSVTPRSDGSSIVDLGQNLVGRVRLTVRGAQPGRRIVLRHAEMLTDGGDLYLNNLRRAEARDVYITCGDPVETWEPIFTVHGFRYVEVTGYPGQLYPDHLTARVLHSNLPWSGEFRCDDADITRLYQNIVWSQRGNFVGVPTDCPQRDERLGWLGDAQVFLPTATRSEDVSAFVASWLEDVLVAQSDEGAFPDVAPVVGGLDGGAPAWGDAGVIVPMVLYRRYGDRRLLERCYRAMTRWVDYVHRHNPDLVWRNNTGRNYGDWLQVGHQTPREVLSTAYFAHSARLVAEAADVLGRDRDAARYTELAAGIRAVFQREFVAADGRVHGGTQTGCLLALEFDLLPPALVPPAVAHLAADIEAQGRHLATGFIGVSQLCPVLTRFGRSDLAYALLRQDTYPSWLFSVRHGATTIWERWDGWTPERGFQSASMNSFNHYSLGAVGEWMFAHVAGIDQRASSVAYSELVLRPQVDSGLSAAAAVQESPRGRVECAWRLAGDTLTLRAQIPPGATATIHVPTCDPEAVTERGRPVLATERRRPAGRVPNLAATAEEGAVVCTVRSGRYRFQAPAPVP